MKKHKQKQNQNKTKPKKKKINQMFFLAEPCTAAPKIAFVVRWVTTAATRSYA